MNCYLTDLKKIEKRIIKILNNLDISSYTIDYNSLLNEGIESRKAGMTYKAIEIKLADLTQGVYYV